ncbi:5-formyltetrahydrofolate cyclo-ligase [Sphingobium sp. HWE2-09]|uniref:5-formyltetrahydrofolate cyclo-ligase n=1 Tax=Sphingobium sp. HWE2-09 TaxID=3108390 RepID=UPI002DC75182|nr:5-formyltetrahydrofolate cyclo-ligase [Sphingobium sp. HWE2-09]
MSEEWLARTFHRIGHMAIQPETKSLCSSKSLLRAILRRSRSDFLLDMGVANRNGATAHILTALVPIIASNEMVAGYASQADEPDVLPLLADRHKLGRPVSLPHVRDGKMEFVSWSPAHPLVPGYAGIRVPAYGSSICEPSVLLVPLLGFDRHGGRLGQGGGFYDRFLERRPAAKRIGVAWSIQEVEEVPREPWDIPLTAIVTERETIMIKPSPS